MAIQISRFKRPGVFIQEFDQSVQFTPVQDALINLVPGFSRKGPINRPVLVSSPAEFQNIFGSIDRTLEKNKDFFHRTVLNNLNQAPIWALNLLKTNDELDLLEWKSISTASINPNSVLYENAYSEFFDKNEFWIRDTDAFLNLAKKRQPTKINEILHITNMSDTKISTFMYKSSLAGFDIKAEDWYGGRDKVPTWMYPDDLISDYMVSLLVIGGDWSNYQTLSVDPRWSRYFNANGLIKTEVQHFINDPAVSILNFYDVSLIPFFRDQNGTDFYIETVVNRDTDKTGLFVSFDVDSLETDNPNGLIDLIGYGLAGTDTSTIEFLSYKEVITETVKFVEKPLVSAGNAFIDPRKNVVLPDGTLSAGLFETKWINSPVFNVTPSDANDPSVNKVSRIEIINDANLILNGTSLIINSGQEVAIPDVSLGRIRKDTIYIDSLGQIGVQIGIETSEFADWDAVPLVAISDFLYPIAIVQVGTQNDGSITTPYLGVPDNNAIEFLSDLIWELITNSTAGTGDADIFVEFIRSYEVAITFNNTKDSDVDINYRKSRSLRVFNELRQNVDFGVSVVREQNGVLAVILADNSQATSGYIIDGNKNKEARFVVSTTFTIADPLELYIADDAFELGEIGMRAVATLPDFGQVSKSSSFYKQYYDGVINSGDFFYQNILKNGDGVNATTFFKDTLGQSNIVSYTRDNPGPGEIYGSIVDNIEIDGAGGDMVYFQGTYHNDKVYTILSSAVEQQSGGYDINGEKYDYKNIFIVNESITEENIFSQLITLHDGNPEQTVYLRMYIIQSELYVDFVNSPVLEVAGEQRINADNNPVIWVHSDRSSFSQTIEIETVLEQNQFLIDANRYGEVTLGDFLDAAIPNDLPIGAVPKTLTRIIGRQAWEADPSLALISTDAAVAYFDADPSSSNSDFQVTRRTTVDRYVNTYQALVLSGFRMREDSIPNGTEKRQEEILNVLAPGSPIFKGLTNRNQLSWRYLIDPWGLGLTNNSKQQFVDLCGVRLNCLGLLNMPSAKDFKNSTNPSFTNDDGTINYNFVKLGGDPESNPAFRYTFAQGSGQSNVAYFYPYASINDNGRPVDVPPTIFVAQTFMNKHNSRRSDLYPWTIAAGITNGLVTGFGATEVDITNEAIEELNELGANPIVFKINRGYNIETNNTAQVIPKSALSNIHVREVLIQLEDELYNMLINYQWRFNTAEVRAEIKQRADAICARFVAQNGLFDYFNQMDETNNTNEIIDAGIGVLDTFVEPIKGMGIIVNNITILRTGTIESGGFAVQ